MKKSLILSAILAFPILLIATLCLAWNVPQNCSGVGDTWDSTNGWTCKPAPYAYDGTTVRQNAFPAFITGTANASGVVTFNLTTDGTPTGPNIFPNGVILKSLQPFVNDASLPYSYGGVSLAVGNKTLNMTVNRAAGILTILSLSVLGAPIAANGSAVNLTVWGY